jgi:hypothetical protein
MQHKSQASAIESVNSPWREACSFRDTPRCAVFTRTSGEDTVGTAPPFSRFLFVEVPLPWPKKVWKAKGVPPGVVKALKQSKARGLDLKARAIAPDHEYSQPGFTRVLHFRRPEGAFTTFFRDEFLVPCKQAALLLNALLGSPDTDLQPFERFRADNSGVRDLLVCTHGTEDACCGTFGFPLYHRLWQHYAARSDGQLRAWRVSHIGGHRFAPTVLDFPHGHCWAHLDSETLDVVVRRQGPVERLRCHYRGLSGWDFFEQVAEREIFLREGWVWTIYLKAGQVLTLDGQEPGPSDLMVDPVFDDDSPRHAEVRITYQAPDGSAGSYKATIEFSSRMVGLGDCGLSPWERNVYQVSRLEKTQVFLQHETDI